MILFINLSQLSGAEINPNYIKRISVALLKMERMGPLREKLARGRLPSVSIVKMGTKYLGHWGLGSLDLEMK
jgi:hypothetical protein